MNAEISRFIHHIDGGVLFDLKDPDRSIMLGMFALCMGIVSIGVFIQYWQTRNDPEFMFDHQKRSTKPSQKNGPRVLGTKHLNSASNEILKKLSFT